MDNPRLSEAIRACKDVDLGVLIGQKVTLKKVSSRELAGPCPKCGGRDRLHVHLDKGWFCRKCQDDSHWHDAIDWAQFLFGDNLIMAIDRLIGQRITSRADLHQHAQERERQEAQRKEQAAQQHAAALASLQTSRAWEKYHANLNDQARTIWRTRGIPDDWQDYLQLGYCANRLWSSEDARFVSDSLTIPYLRYSGSGQYEVISLKHRLLLDQAPGGKYRPEVCGLGSQLYTPDYSQPLTPTALIVEGEFKAMVAHIHLWGAAGSGGKSISVVGIPGKSIHQALLESLQACQTIVILLDPDAYAQAKDLRGLLGNNRSKIICLPKKVDDLLNEGIINGPELTQIIGA